MMVEGPQRSGRVANQIVAISALDYAPGACVYVQYFMGPNSS
jgi:hypothetical protein